jgi:guanine deaminase
VTPRFSLSTTNAMLDACAQLMGVADDLWFTSHLNENPAEVAEVASLFPGAGHYLDSYAAHGLVTDRSVFAHNVHATDAELDLMASTGAWASHCPTSNAALGSGLFPLRRHHEHGARVAMGSDVGAGTGFSMIKEGLQAYFMQQLLGTEGLPLTPAHLLYLSTRAGAQALGLDDHVGDLRVGKDFDAVLIEPRAGSTLAMVLPHAADANDALAKIFALANPGDVGAVWVGGEVVGAAAGARTARQVSPLRPPPPPEEVDR